MPVSKTLVGSILDLPEPIRSQSLARMNMTAEEFEAHQAGCRAWVAEAQRRYENGEPASTWQNDEAGSASISVVKDWEPS